MLKIKKEKIKKQSLNKIIGGASQGSSKECRELRKKGIICTINP